MSRKRKESQKCTEGGVHEWVPGETIKAPDYLVICRKCRIIRMRSEISGPIEGVESERRRT